MYSQKNEEEILLKFFEGQPAGRFLDIGAYDGKTFSNTLALAERGWSGACVEPCPYNFARLMELHKDRPAIHLINAAVVNKAQGLTQFWDSHGDGIGTLIPAHKEKWERGYSVKYQPYWLLPLPVDALFLTFGYDFQFINLDVEGHSADLFLHLPLERLALTCRCFCIEHDGRQQELAAVAGKHGYQPIALNPENLILAK